VDFHAAADRRIVDPKRVVPWSGFQVRLSQPARLFDGIGIVERHERGDERFDRPRIEVQPAARESWILIEQDTVAGFVARVVVDGRQEFGIETVLAVGQ
jgi:hypothetical protein